MESLFFHLKVVHIPIALAMLMPLISGGIWLAWWRNWLAPRSWVLVIVMQAMLLASGIVALKTGELEEDQVESVVPKHAIEDHEAAAEAFVWTSAGVLALMLLALAMRRHKAALPLAALASLGTIVGMGLGYQTGQAGGNLVYRYNAASVYADQNANLVEVQASVSIRDEGRDVDD